MHEAVLCLTGSDGSPDPPPGMPLHSRRGLWFLPPLPLAPRARLNGRANAGAALRTSGGWAVLACIRCATAVARGDT